MVPRRAVVVGVDGSADSLRAVRWAAARAAGQHAPMHLVFALPQSAELPFTEAEKAERAEFATHLLDEASAQARIPGLHITSEVVDAAPARALIRAARHAVMVVVGSHGHGQVTGLLLGSVAQHVSRHAACPVVAVRPPAHPDARRVVVGVDGSPSSHKALDFAFETASREGELLVVIHGWQDTQGPATVGDRIDAAERLLSETLAGWSEKYPDVPVVREAIPVHPVTALTTASEFASLVVVGSRGRGAFAELMLGSTSQAVLHHAHCPVAVIR